MADRKIALVLNVEALRSYHASQPVDILWRSASRDERAMVKAQSAERPGLEGMHKEQLQVLGFAWRTRKKTVEIGQWYNPNGRYVETTALSAKDVQQAGLPVREIMSPGTRVTIPQRSVCNLNDKGKRTEDLPDPRINVDSALCKAEHTTLGNIVPEAFDRQIDTLKYEVLVDDDAWIDRPTPTEIRERLAAKPGTHRVTVMGALVIAPVDPKGPTP